MKSARAVDPMAVNVKTPITIAARFADNMIISLAVVQANGNLSSHPSERVQ
jgi:hypothetical protein